MSLSKPVDPNLLAWMANNAHPSQRTVFQQRRAVPEDFPALPTAGEPSEESPPEAEAAATGSMAPRRTLADIMSEGRPHARPLMKVYPYAAFMKGLAQGLVGSRWEEEAGTEWYQPARVSNSLDRNTCFRITLSEMAVLSTFAENPSEQAATFMKLQTFNRQTILQMAGLVVIVLGVAQGWAFALRSEVAQGVEKPFAIKTTVVNAPKGRKLACIAEAERRAPTPTRIVQAIATKDDRKWIEERYSFEKDLRDIELNVDNSFNSTWTQVKFKKEKPLEEIFRIAKQMQKSDIAVRLTIAGVIFLKTAPANDVAEALMANGATIGGQAQARRDTLLVIVKTGRIQIDVKLRDAIIKELGLINPKVSFTKQNEFGFFASIEVIPSLIAADYDDIEVECPSMRQMPQASRGPEERDIDTM